ncbi:MAG: NUDIX domain-containing protein [Pseudomonadota bacterium]
MSNEMDFDPEAVPIRPAATVMIIDDRPELEVLMIERNARMAFAPGMWVFPGGAVDPGEADEFEPHCDGLDDVRASGILGVETGGLAYWVAAIRENFEEAGLLLGRRDDGGATDPDTLRAPRDRLNTRAAGFLEIARELQLMLDTRRVHYIARWITPLGSPRRFDARFFLSRPPAGQDVALDATETVGWMWVRPDEALARFDRGEMVMMTPTVRMLRCLAMFNSADDAIASAAAELDDHRARVRYDDGDTYTIVLPGDDGYDTADPDRENGWVRWRPLTG